MVVAVSGGPDSVALFALLRQLERTGGYKVVALAHFNHRLRGPDSDADEHFCRQLAERAGVPFANEGADVRAAARESKTSIEDAARRLRYDFLERVRIAQQADLVAVGHTRDDQAETFLLRAARGAGARGLSGIRESRGSVVRPLLELGRNELHEWVAAQGLEFRIDATNADIAIPRNRIRHEVLPALERISPGARAALARSARLSEDDDDFLEARAIEALSTLVLSSEGQAPGTLHLDATRLNGLHPAVARRVVRRAAAEVAPGRFLALAHVDLVLELGSGSLDLPGLRVEIGVTAAGGRVLRLERAAGRAGAAGTPKSNVFCYPLSIPGEVVVPESGVAIAAELLEGDARSEKPGTRLAVRVRAGAVHVGLAVRNRKPGDRFRPVGLGGSKKLQDYFVDRKVPRSERDRVPLVVDARDRIVWVVGHTIAEDFNDRSEDPVPEGAVLLLKVRHLGESV